MNSQEILDDIVAAIRPQLGKAGAVANYIPALARVNPCQFGIALRTRDGVEAWAGDAMTPFSIQSISKVFSLTMAMRLAGERLWERIGREPSGNPFNSLMQLESEQGIPRNPFINAGAIAVADCLVTCGDDPKSEMLALISSLCDEPVHIDEEVAASEAATGFRNVALANFIKSFGKLDNDVCTVLDVYFRQCAIPMNCLQLARAVNFLCRDGSHPFSGVQVISARQARRINALMLTCGTYDAAGEFAFLIGLPCKSGVGGGIVAIVPDTLSLCVWSPALDASHNSLLGQKALEMFTSRTGLSIF
ncbi:Glutaminase, core [Desulfurispirillum indicum S5]|uniref:Glutaminase n=1 Tax=Desulfurispirillum indicum (strain ATCC BAA-1389 / DSM 22839 / S5) TaxID=653733 RepID=E6W6R5_DESIS|nr:glutaminase [Desulfurispirillum indicum]ADU65065.1 Glutaminase, core [Desulfurispirillum indicum S5]